MKGFIEVTKKYYNEHSGKNIESGKGFFNVNHIVEVFEDGFYTTQSYQGTSVSIQTKETYEELKVLIKNAGRKAKTYPVKQMGMRVPEAVFDQCVNACKKITEEFEARLKNNS